MKERKNGKLQITPLKFEGVQILYPNVLEFAFYFLKFGMFRFSPLRFRTWILPSKFWKCLDFTSPNSKNLESKIQNFPNFRK